MPSDEYRRRIDFEYFMPPMLAIAAVIACGLAAYLVVAMLAPERFS